MNGNNIKILAERVRGIGRELLAIANQIEAEAPHLSVQLPQPDLFSGLFDGFGAQTVEQNNARMRAENGQNNDELPAAEELPQPQEDAPKSRHYTRVGRAMTEHRAVASSEKLGRAQGFCNRTDIERTIVRLTGRNREDVRDAVNAVADALQLVCIKSGGYRYYNRDRRAEIVTKSCQQLERI